ncbi:30028_t:CDS:2, partial [Racocetra persica]
MYYYLAAIFAFVSYFLYKCYIYPLYLSPLRKIPGPPVDNLILGHYSSLLKKDHGKVFFHLAKQYGGIVRYHALLNKPYLLITDPKLVQMILMSRSYDFPRFNMNITLVKELIGEGIILSEGNSHKRQRKMMSPSFSFANVKEMTPTFVQAGHNLKAIWMKEIGNKREEKITITAIISKITLDVIGLVGNLLPFIRKFPTSDNNKYYDSIKTINNISEKLIAYQKNCPVQGTDLLSLLVKANGQLPVEEQLTHYELVSQVMTLLIAGHETTSVTLSWALYFLAANPDIQDRLRKEILDILPDRDYHPTFDQIEQLKFLECVFKEVLRIVPPVPTLIRTNAKDETLNGYFIPKNTPLSIPIYAIHRDPSIWGDDAEHFNPSRWLNPEIKSNITNSNFIPFNTGPRSCLGMRMADLEFKSILAVIIRNLEFKLVEGFTFGRKFVGILKPTPGIDLLVSK